MSKRTSKYHSSIIPDQEMLIGHLCAKRMATVGNLPDAIITFIIISGTIPQIDTSMIWPPFSSVSVMLTQRFKIVTIFGA